MDGGRITFPSTNSAAAPPTHTHTMRAPAITSPSSTASICLPCVQNTPSSAAKRIRRAGDPFMPTQRYFACTRRRLAGHSPAPSPRSKRLGPPSVLSSVGAGRPGLSLAVSSSARRGRDQLSRRSSVLLHASESSVICLLERLGLSAPRIAPSVRSGNGSAERTAPDRKAPNRVDPPILERLPFPTLRESLTQTRNRSFFPMSIFFLKNTPFPFRIGQTLLSCC